jgi:hypothetical protein
LRLPQFAEFLDAAFGRHVADAAVDDAEHKFLVALFERLEQSRLE